MNDRRIGKSLALACAIVLVVSAPVAMMPGEAEAQDTDARVVYYGCYVPQSGAVYLIKGPGMPEACRSDKHVEFSFTYTDGQSLGAADGEPPALYVDDEGVVHATTTLTVGNTIDIDGEANTISTGPGDALELHVGGARALRLEPQSGDHPNVIGGSVHNHVGNGVPGATISGGGTQDHGNSVLDAFGTVGGGLLNITGQGSYNTVGGGGFNVASGYSSTVGGGELNTASGNNSTVGGGLNNTADGDYSTVPGGVANKANGNGSFAAGTQAKAEHDYSTAMGRETTASGEASTAMGWATTAGAQASTAMGRGTVASGTNSTAMGLNTTASDGGSTAMGVDAEASGWRSTAMGSGTKATNDQSTAMGNITTASGIASTAMGQNTTASGHYSTAMGLSTTASGNYSTAMGRRASTNGHSGSYVYGDALDRPVVNATADNQFMVQASGGTIFYSNARASHGVELAPGGGAWAEVSDASLKENFRGEDGEEVLSKIRDMQVRSWNYKAQGPSIRHVGPTAQDFHAAFGFGTSDRTITTTDIHGINMLAAQALERRTRELQRQLELKDQEIGGLRAELARLLDRVERLEAKQ